MKKTLKPNGQIFNPSKKLLIGIILFASFYLLYYITGGPNGLYDVKKFLKLSVFNIFPSGFAGFLSSISIAVIGLTMVYLFVSGLYRMCTFNIYLPTFEDNTPGGTPVRGCDSFPNINRVLSYRESKMCSMSPERAADLYVGSSKIESLYTNYNNGPETQRALSYIESKLSSMSSDRALNYLANKL